MSNDSTSISSARDRIRAAYDPELLRSAGHCLSDLLGDHFQQIEQSAGKVLNWEDPWRNTELAASSLDQISRDHSNSIGSGDLDVDSKSKVDQFAKIVRTVLARGHNLHDPRYIGHQVPAPIPIAGLFDAAGSVTNQVMAIYEMGPWASAVERAMVEQLGQLIGWKKDEFAGFVTHGGSLANLTALLTARNVSLCDSWERGTGRDGLPPVLVSHADAHYCIARSAGILGLGTNQVVRAALDERRRIDPNRLDETLREFREKNQPIIAVVAGACATPIGAFDPLNDIADVCRKHEVWMHVDAAHGAAVCFSARHRHLVDGLERADSLIWDAHKMLFVPALCAFVFYRNRDHRFEAFRQDAPYLFDPSAPGLAEFDSGLMTIECTKRAATFGLWGVWSLFGPQIFADMVDVTFEMGRRFYEMLSDAADFETIHEPECNIVAFRHVPDDLGHVSDEKLGEFQFELRRELIQSGEFYIVPTTANGVGALRVTIINPLTDESHLKLLMSTLRTRGRGILERSVRS